MAKLVTGPPKFTHPEWTHSNLSNYANAEGERQAAERLIAESDRLVDETANRTHKTQRDVNKKLEQRIGDIKYWKGELDEKLDGVKNETENLLAFKTRLEKCLEACEEPLYIAQQCLQNRKKRKAIDLVHDDVEKELLKEVETIQGVMNLLRRTLDQATEQIRHNRKAKYNLEKDLKDKFSAMSIDDHCHELRNNSASIGFKEGAAKIESISVTPEDWQDFSDKNILNAEQQRNLSVQLRSMIDGILQQSANDMSKQVETTNIAFDKRISETRDAKAKLEDHLSKVLRQINDMEENLAKLQKAAQDKENPLKLSETRLDTRTNRPNVELCRDPVQYRLINEVSEINMSIAALQEKIAQSESSLKGLIRNQLSLEEDIDVKSNSLMIDEVQCMGMRKSINIQTF